MGIAKPLFIRKTENIRIRQILKYKYRNILIEDLCYMECRRQEKTIDYYRNSSPTKYGICFIDSFNGVLKRWSRGHIPPKFCVRVKKKFYLYYMYIIYVICFNCNLAFFVTSGHLKMIAI